MSSLARRLPLGWIVAILMIAGVVMVFNWPEQRRSQAEAFTYEVINIYPHDAEAYCQGLVIDGDALYESTGGFGKSSLREIDLATGRVRRQKELAEEVFGEGLALVEDKLVQLTWRSGQGIVYRRDTLQEVDRFSYQGEGWGLTYDGERLIMSDGTATLRFLDPDTYQVTGTLQVRDGGRPVERLNELEFVEGEIFANIWYMERIARISPESGEVLAWVDLGGLLAPGEISAADEVLNGIAYDPRRERLFVTGKNWPRLFEIRVVRR